MDALDLQFGRFVLDIAVKTTALLAVTGIALLALHKASAATRHLVAVAGLAGALAIPALAFFLPAWDLPVLPGERHVLGESSWDARKLGTGDPSWASLEVRAGENASVSPAAGLSRTQPGIVALARRAGIAWVAMTWAAIAALALARLLVGLSRVRGAALRAAPPPREDWAIPYIRASRALGLRRFVRLGLTDEVEVAMTAGAREPVVLVPASAGAWPEERRRLVLLHELAHVKRLDWLSQLICEVALALWWFHPLAWIAAARVRRDAELAADDLVLRAGERPSVYAGHLLDIVRSLRADRDTVGAMAMARASGFESRLRALLEARRRGPASTAGRVAAAGLSSIALLLAAVHPTPAQASEQACEAGAEVATPSSEPHFSVGKVRDAFANLGTSGFYQRGMALHREGRYPEAIQAFRKAIARDERTGESAYNIACGYARLGDRDSALGWLAKASTLGFDLSRFLMDDDDLLSLRADPRFRDLVRRVREESSEGQARSRKAISRFEKMSDDPPTSADPWASVGKELLKAGEYDRAADAFREAAQRAMRPGTSLYNAACALALQGDDEAALVELERAVEGGFDDPKLLRNDPDLATLHDDPKFEELAKMEEALAMPRLRVGRSLRRSDIEAWKKAAEGFEAYAREHEDSGRALFNAGYARLYAGEEPKSAQHFARALELGYRKPATLYNLACAEARQGHADRAFEWLGKALDAGFDGKGMLRTDEDLESLRSDPRFRELVRRTELAGHLGAF
ncbi:MAG: tetratricopeptide repeat protein [Deltaproteobacteria bacterium]|nr:MAG: tetratricopeptide repeat protein [Deltaproteobacteria bacterium]TMB34385.1 MAG: tetratricopeptide repeat protein [Deltaproteobacteria bacterium]